MIPSLNTKNIIFETYKKIAQNAAMEYLEEVMKILNLNDKNTNGRN